MTTPSRKFLDDALALPEADRLDLASELIDGPSDGDWKEVWTAEIDRRVAAAERRGDAGGDWSEARARILAQFGKR